MRARWIVIGTVVAMLAAACGSENGTGPTNKGPAGRLYVLNQGDKTMYVYDTKTLKKVAEIETVVDQPHYIEFAPDGLNFYITTLPNSGNRGFIAKFNASTLAFIDSASVPIAPTAIAITSDSRYGYVCDFTKQVTKVRKYDLSTLEEVNSVQAGIISHDLKITSDGSVVIVTNRDTDNLTLVYPDADTVTFVPMTDDDPNPTSSNFGPMGAVIDHRDSLAFIACLDSEEIRVLDIAARKIVDSISIPIHATGEPSGPTLMAVLPDNDVVFTTTQFGNSIVAVRMSTKQVLADIPVATAGPFGISMSDDGSRIYAASRGISEHGRVYIFDGNTYQKIDSIDVGNQNYGVTWHAN